MVKKHFWLYVLKLSQGKYYVGITSKTPEERFQEHKDKKRAAYWTMRYEPIKIIQTKDLGYTTESKAKAFENKVTREYIKKKGLNNVRGGDLRDDKPYVVRFGRIYDLETWQAAMGIILMSLLFLYAYLLK